MLRIMFNFVLENTNTSLKHNGSQNVVKFLQMFIKIGAKISRLTKSSQIIKRKIKIFTF